MKYIFSLATRYVGSEVKEEVELATEGLNADEEYNEVTEAYIEWMSENNHGGWYRADEV